MKDALAVFKGWEDVSKEGKERKNKGAWSHGCLTDHENTSV